MGSEGTCFLTIWKPLFLLAWKIPGTEKPGGLQSMGSLRVGHDFTFTFTFHFHALEREMATHSSVLAWRIPGTGEPGGLQSLGSHRVGHDWSDLAAAAAAAAVFTWEDIKIISKSRLRVPSRPGWEHGWETTSDSQPEKLSLHTWVRHLPP